MNFSRLSANHGSAFISAALASGVMAILVAGFLKYLSNEHLLNVRSHIWNQGLHLAEAGVETGFAELNYQYYRGEYGFTTARGWTNTDSGTYVKTVSNLADNRGKIVGNFTVTVSGVGSINPLIRAVATLPTTPTGPPISRAVEARLYVASRFPTAFLSKTWMNMNGNNIYTDSYDSTDWAKSTGGMYDASKKRPNGNIASNGTVMNTLNIGNANIYGVAYTGPGGTVSMGPSGSIGPTFVSGDRATTVSEGLANGWIQSDFNVDVPDVVLPSGATTWGGAPGATGTGVGSIVRDTTIDTGNYRVNSIVLNSSAHGDTMTINGNVSLYVMGDVDVAGLGQIVINPGASLKIYVAGSCRVTGNGLINNSVTPINNQWYGLPSSTSWTVNGNGRWIGTIYAPQAEFTMNGGGTAGDMSGAVVANTVTLNGQVRFHYDESLRSSNTGAGYAFMSWQELRLVNGAWVP